VDKEARAATAANHSATHLLHQALRTILGSHVEQKGSLVSPTHLRFDFSHFSKLTDEELKQVEDFVNTKIKEKLALVEKRNIPISEAVKEGAMALFGEKYGDAVRVIKFGNHAELCGGTHVQNTADIWQFKIKSEGAIAAGIRRIEAITGKEVEKYYKALDTQFSQLKKTLKNPTDLLKTVDNMLADNQQLRKEVAQLKKEKAGFIKVQLKNEFESIDDIYFLSKKLDMDSATIKDLLFSFGKEIDNAVAVIGTQTGDKVIVSLYISKPVAEKYDLHAGNLIREIAKEINGGGGGQPFFATAGGKNPAGLDKALSKAKELIVGKMK